MKNTSLEPYQEKIDNSLHIIRESPMNVVIVGGGKRCYYLLKALHEENRLSKLKMNILGVADVNPEAPGLVYARNLNLFATGDLKELFNLEDLNLIIELTGSPEVREEILRTKPSGVSFMDHWAARLLWDLIQMETEKTELERERLKYQEKERKHTKDLLDSLPYRIAVINMDMTIDTVNQTFLKDLDLTYEQVLGRHCYEIRYGRSKQCENCYLNNYLKDIKKRAVVSRYKEYLTEEGKKRFDVITTAPMYDENGELVRIIEATRDATDRVNLEMEVQKSNTFFQNVIQSTVDGIVVVDTKGYVLIFNEGMENLTGYTAAEILDTGHVTKFYPIDVAKENMKKMRSDQYGPVDKLNPTSMSITTKSGEEIPVTLTASIIRIDGEETGSVGVFTDMREILQMRKELEDAHFQLVQSEKTAYVGRMAAGVAHEINNPLSGVLIFAELLKESLKNQPKVQKDAQEIIDQTLRCKKIVAELLEFSRQSIGQAMSFSLEHLITQCLNLLLNQALFQDINVKAEIAQDMPEMHGDMGQLQQVFINLFINAAHAMEGKGELDIEANFDADKNHFVVTVSDTGPGIPDDLRDKIFDIFFTTKPVGKGTGLGLSISQNIIDLHGGILKFECPPEGGTTFIVELPLKSGDIPVEEPLFIGLDE